MAIPRVRIAVSALLALAFLASAVPVRAQVLPPSRGGTGTSTAPSLGDVQVGQANGTWGPQPTSSLNIDADLTNKTTSDLTEGSNLYYTLARVQAALIGGYNAIFGSATTTNATSTNLAVTGSFNFLGTVITNVSTWFAGLFDTHLATKTTTDLAEGSNLYWTQDRFAGALAGTTTDALAEGSTNRYFTDARVGSYITGSSTLAAYLNYWTKSGTVLFYSGGSVGIGTTSPAYPLAVTGDVNATGRYRVNAFPVVYVPNQSTFPGSIFFGNGGGFLSFVSGGDGQTNTALGIDALLLNTTGQQNTAVGYEALESNTTGIRNNAIGQGALKANTTGGANNAIGQGALFQNTTGGNNNAMGYQALYDNSSGNSNTAVGSLALTNNTTGNNNVGIGLFASGVNSTGGNNTSVGYQAVYNANSNNNTGLGYRAGFGATSGANNTFLGYQAGDNLTTGSNNLIIGYDIDAPSATASNQLNIGNIIFGTGVSGTGTTIAGNVGIGTTSPWRTLSVAGTVAFSGLTSSATGNALCITTAKDVTDAGGGTCTPSSLRFKENVLDLPNGQALSILERLRVVSFDYTKETANGEQPHAYGLIAEEVEEIDSRLVDYGTDGSVFSLHFERITGLLVQAVQELAANDKAQDDRLDELEARLEALELENRGLRAGACVLTSNH